LNFVNLGLLFSSFKTPVFDLVIEDSLSLRPLKDRTRKASATRLSSQADGVFQSAHFLDSLDDAVVASGDLDLALAALLERLMSSKKWPLSPTGEHLAFDGAARKS
jgi:hypothetical protein